MLFLTPQLLVPPARRLIVPSGAVWDITSAPETVLSESNLRVTNPSNCASDNYELVSTTCGTAEKKYIEIEIVSLGTGGAAYTAFFLTAPGGGYAFESPSGSGNDGTVLHKQGWIASGGLAAADIISWAVDGPNGNGFFGINGAYPGSQDPTNSDHFASNASVYWTPGSVVISVLTKIAAGGGAPFSYRLKADAAHQTYSPPAGYSRWS